MAEIPAMDPGLAKRSRSDRIQIPNTVVKYVGDIPVVVCTYIFCAQFLYKLWKIQISAKRTSYGRDQFWIR